MKRSQGAIWSGSGSRTSNFELIKREQFQLYERRRSEGELQATAVTAAALTFAALLIAGADQLAALGDVPRYGLAITLLALVVAMAFASVARFGLPAAPCGAMIFSTASLEG